MDNLFQNRNNPSEDHYAEFYDTEHSQLAFSAFVLICDANKCFQRYCMRDSRKKWITIGNIWEHRQTESDIFTIL